MGSSPVTATIPFPDGAAQARLDAALMRFAEDIGLAADDGVVIAFSGGPDSLALALTLARLAARQPLRLIAAHLDHALDPDSPRRARAARELAQRIGIPFTGARRDVALAGRGLEAAARDVRYRYLEAVRAREGARFIATAHHADDQAETVALRLLLGTGLEGLAGIQPVLGQVIRPFLAVRRAEIQAALASSSLDPVRDPTNAALDRPRNRLRHGLLRQGAIDGVDASRLAALASTARTANEHLENALRWLFSGAPPESPPSLDVARLRTLPAALQGRALTLLHRRSGHPLPPSRAAQAAVLAQVAGGQGLDVDCGRGLRWREADGRLRVESPPEPAPPSFTYTFQMPAHVHIAELGLALDVRRGPVEPWMFEGSPWRAGLRAPATATLAVRNRRAGDRLRPLGAPGSRKLKDLLIDRKVPRARRARLPLLLVDGELAWVPGLALDHRFRLDADSEACIVEITPA